jgi:DNA-binding XRE family transcriptional regulator
MVTPAQFKMARAAVSWTVREAAGRAGLHRNTIVRMEAGAVAEERTHVALRLTYERAGVTFLDDDGTGYGVRFREPKNAGNIRGALNMSGLPK